MRPWIANAENIGKVGEDDLVITPSLKNFAEPRKMETEYFVVAPYGIGKTLFLQYKRQLYEIQRINDSHWADIYFIPHDNRADRNQASISITPDKIDILKNIGFWEKIWALCISLSIIKAIKTPYEGNDDNEERDRLDRLVRYLPNEIREMIEKPLLFTPYGYLNEILKLSFERIIRVVHNQYLLDEIIKTVRSDVAIFIDNTDEYFHKHLKPSNTDSFSGVLSPNIWYAGQIGLMSAIGLLSGLNDHIKVFASIRKEAYRKLLKTDALGLQRMGNALDIKYSLEELKSIFIKNIKRMDKADLANPHDLENDPLYSFLGLQDNKITNVRADNQKEDIFHYIYRHTLRSPRDFMLMGAFLSKIGVNERTEEKIRTVVNDVGSAISDAYMNEMKLHLDFDKFEALFELIHSNILSKSEIVEICQQFNHEKICKNKDCKQCEKTHVFCNLYKIGLLGVVDRNQDTDKIVQKFENPGERVFESNILPQSEYYLIHPILNSQIYEITKMSDRATYYIYPRVIVGYGYPWRDPKKYKTTRYCSFINCICSQYRNIDKRGVFLASSNNKRDVMKELYKKLQELNLPLEMDKWTKREGIETRRIFCHEVCPKISRNLWMIAEVSDFNPNVFFECGFAMGLGRNVIFLCDENAGKIKSKLGEQLYESYKTIDNITNKLERIPDTFSKIEINSLYRVPEVFRHIDKFDLPNEREKRGVDYVLTFNDLQPIIRMLSNDYGCTIVGINRLKKSFLPLDLVEGLIDAKTVLVNLSGVQKEPRTNTINDSQLLCLAGICVSQGVPVMIFQSNDNFYSDVHGISVVDNTGEYVVDFIHSV